MREFRYDDVSHVYRPEISEDGSHILKSDGFTPIRKKYRFTFREELHKNSSFSKKSGPISRMDIADALFCESADFIEW